MVTHDWSRIVKFHNANGIKLLREVERTGKVSGNLRV